MPEAGGSYQGLAPLGALHVVNSFAQPQQPAFNTFGQQQANGNSFASARYDDTQLVRGGQANNSGIFPVYNQNGNANNNNSGVFANSFATQSNVFGGNGYTSGQAPAAGGSMNSAADSHNSYGALHMSRY